MTVANGASLGTYSCSDWWCVAYRHFGPYGIEFNCALAVFTLTHIPYHAQLTRRLCTTTTLSRLFPKKTYPWHRAPQSHMAFQLTPPSPFWASKVLFLMPQFCFNREKLVRRIRYLTIKILHMVCLLVQCLCSLQDLTQQLMISLLVVFQFMNTVFKVSQCIFQHIQCLFYSTLSESWCFFKLTNNVPSLSAEPFQLTLLTVFCVQPLHVISLINDRLGKGLAYDAIPNVDGDP